MTSDAGIIFSSTTLFDVAAIAASNSPEDRGNERDRSGQALIAVVFSALTLEALFQELALYLDDPENAVGSTLHDLGSELRELEMRKAPLRDKARLWQTKLTGAAELGGGPLQQMLALLDLRDALVHHKPEQFTGIQRAGDQEALEVVTKRVLAKLPRRYLGKHQTLIDCVGVTSRPRLIH